MIPRLFLRLRRNEHEHASCIRCHKGVIALTEVRPSGAARVAQLVGRHRFDAWCLDCVGQAEAHHAGRATIWWFPRPTIATWDDLAAVTDLEPATCCGCGGFRGRVRFAVWASGWPASWFDAYCNSCFATVDPALDCDFADLGECAMEDEFIARAVAASSDRQPVPDRNTPQPHDGPAQPEGAR